jgi:hypothetical protein
MDDEHCCFLASLLAMLHIRFGWTNEEHKTLGTGGDCLYDTIAF